MALTETAIKAAKPKDKPYMLRDDRGLWLLIVPGGGKYWRLRYWVEGKEKKVSLGTYPSVTLREARERRDALHKSRAEGVDPAEVMRGKRSPSESTFGRMAQEWLDKQIRGVCTSKYVRDVLSRLERLIFPVLGERDIREITAPDLLRVFRDIEDQDKVYSAHQVSSYCSRIFRYAVATGRAERDPTADLRGALQPYKVEHRAALIDPGKIVQLVRAMNDFDGTPVVRAALWFSAYTFARPGEIRKAEWTEIDLEATEWRIPAEKMKMRRPHIVPLARQVVRLLSDLRGLTGRGVYVFPSLRSVKGTVPMSENTVLYALRRMGFDATEMTAHGFRGMASTRLNEMGWAPDVIERQLAHLEANKVRAAYNHAEYLAERREMMQAWADWLEGLTQE